MKYKPLQTTPAPKSLMVPAENQNCYQYLIECSEGYGEYYAVQHMDARYTRTQILHDIDCFAEYLRQEIGISKGDVFTVFMPTTVESIIAFYAINKIGGIANIVHPQLPANALKEAIEDCNSKGVMILDILSKDYVEVINNSGLPCIVCSPSDYASKIKTFGCRIAEGLVKAIFPKINRRVAFRDTLKKYQPSGGFYDNGGDIAVYLNGGGTTGKSKTIMLTSKAINELACRVSKLDKIIYPGEEAEIIVLPLFHCFGLCLGIHMAMCNAGRILPMMQFDAKIFNKLLKKNDVIACLGIPVMFKKLLHSKGFEGPWLKNIRMMFCGGDDCGDKFLDEFNGVLEKWGAPGRLRQGYGLTEVGSVCTVNSNTEYREGSIGWALDGVNVQIWDDNNNVVEDGTVGEIVVSGPTVMAGYYKAEEALGTGLYTDENGVKWVRTGDLGYRDPEPDEQGKYYFFFAGRKKRVLIISGYNIYPSDVEKRVQDNFSYVKDCCMVKGYSDEGKMLLRLYVDLKEDGDHNEFRKQITEFCEKNFSRFSVPKDIVFLKKLPETPLMKIDFMKLTQNKPEDMKYAVGMY